MKKLLLDIDARYAASNALQRRGYDVLFTASLLLGFAGIAGLTAATLTLVLG
jgi:hypothetical protein